MNIKHTGSILVAGIFTIAVLISTGVVPISVAASSTSELQKQVDSLQKQLNSLGSDKQEEQEYQNVLNQQIDLLNEQLDAYQAQLDVLSSQENQQMTEVLCIKSDIDQINNEIEVKNTEIEQMEEEKQETLDQLKGRMRCEYMSDNLSWWEALMSSQDLASFFYNFEYMKRSAEQSQQLKDTLDEQTAQISLEKDELQQQVDELNAKEQEAQRKLDDVEQTKAEVTSVQNSIQQTVNEVNGKLSQSQDKSKQLSVQYQQTKAAQDQASKELARAQAEADASLNDYNGNHGGGGSPSSPNSSTGFICPLPAGSYYVSQPYGNGHTGVDLAAPAGTPIYASKSGTVVTAQYWDGHTTTGMQSYGNMVQIDHGDGSSTLYAHCSSICVSYGQHVSQGQVIGYVGTTGNSSGNHLHFEMKINGSRVDPLKYI